MGRAVGRTLRLTSRPVPGATTPAWSSGALAVVVVGCAPSAGEVAAVIAVAAGHPVADIRDLTEARLLASVIG